MSKLREIADAVGSGKAAIVKTLTEEMLAEGIAPEIIVNEGLVVGMGEIGEKFKNNEVFVPEVLIAARAMKAGLGILQPLLASRDIKPLATIAIGTVKGDLHDIGKNLVGMMLEGAGFGIIDLGIDVTPDAFVDAVANKGADIIGMSALLTTTMPAMRDTVNAINEAGLRTKCKIMIGGAPVTDAFAKEIGADGYSPDAASACDLAKSFIA